MSIETANAILQDIVEMEYPDYQGYCPTANDLRKWIPGKMDINKPLPFQPSPPMGDYEAALRKIPKDKEPDDWESQARYRLTRCKLQHEIDVPLNSRQDKSARIIILNPDDINPRIVATTALEAVLGAWNNEPFLFANIGPFPPLKELYGISSLEDGIIAIHKLWQEVEKKHPGEFYHPIAAILPMKECAAEDCNNIFHVKHTFYTTGGKRKFCTSKCRLQQWRD